MKFNRWFTVLPGNPSEKETETITQLWQSSLFNAHYDVQRYVNDLAQGNLLVKIHASVVHKGVSN